MFISEEEAQKRLNDSRNLFSPSYKPTVERVVVENDNTSSSESDGESTDKEVSGETIAKEKIDSILNIVESSDPSRIRARTSLKGMHDVQVAIGTTAEIIGDRAAAQLYGISTEQASAYNYGQGSLSDLGHGRENDANRVPSRANAMNKVKDTLAEVAAGRLHSALRELTDDKIKDCSAVKVSSIARDMATVMDRVTRDNKNPEHIHFHVFKPEMKRIGEYSTVRVTAPVIVNNPDGGA